jgi:hypothetical protein
MITHCELRYVKRRRLWRFHLVDHDGMSVYESSGSWSDDERGECERVARELVRQCYAGALKVKVPRAERAKVAT